MMCEPRLFEWIDHFVIYGHVIPWIEWAKFFVAPMKMAKMEIILRFKFV